MQKLNGSNRPIKIIIIIIIIAAIGYLVSFVIRNWRKSAVDAAVERQRVLSQAEIDSLKEKLAILQEELRLHKEEIVSEEKLFDAFGEDALLIFPGKKINCDILERQIKALFKYLDQKDYIKAYHLENGTFGLFQTTLKTLFERPPTVIGETRDLFTLLQNMAHIYRAIGKNRLKQIQEILKNEADIIEPAMAVFYNWFVHDDDCKVDNAKSPSLKFLYGYAAFFTNTIAGRAYLYRRDSKIRILTRYYSIQIINRANEAALNPYGMDIGKLIDPLIYDINNRKGLLYQRQYLTELGVLKKQYQK